MAVELDECRTQGCRDWVRAGRPWTLAPSMRKLQVTVASHGLTVYAFPDDSHIIASTPEDHTSFSATGYPTSAPRWVGNAVDIMPRNATAAARKELAALARQIIRDKNAGVPGTEHIKYMNWTDEVGTCRQERWMPNHTTRSSTDRGHIHLSGLSTWAFREGVAYDPVARMAGGDEMANSWTEPLTQGPPGIQGQPRDNAMAYIWVHAHTAAQNSAAILALLKTVAGKVDIDQAELDAIEQASREGADAALQAAKALQADEVANLVVAKLAAAGVGGPATHAQMVEAVKDAFSEAFPPEPTP